MADDDDTLFDERTKTLLRVAPELAPDQTIGAETLLAAGRAPRDAGFDTDVQLDALPGITVRPATKPPPPIGKAPEYAVLSTLGEGGMGRVHLAHQRSLGRDVAVKTLKEDAPRGSARALLLEARLTGSLEHPGVVPVHDLGVDDANRPMLVMKRVDGVDLSTLLANPKHDFWSKRGGDLLGAALEILEQVCLAVEFAHSRGVLHRDIKPENVMVGGFGEVYLLDWGIAATRGEWGEDTDPDSPPVGTPAYMAPEMVLGASIDERTDVYLLGATLHEILTKRPRHTGTSVRAVLLSALASEPLVYPVEIPEALASLCNRATARDPERRPRTVSAFREELVRFQERRASQALCDVAFDRLRALEEMLASSDGAPSDLPRAYRLATEARFAFTQAGEVGAEGMQRCLVTLADLELRQGHADTADALVREMDDPPPNSLLARVADVRDRHAAKEQERARLEKFARDFDPSSLATKRTKLILRSAILVAAVWLVVVLSGRPPTAGALVGLSVLSNVVVLVVFAIVLRRGGNRFNRTLLGFIAVAFAGTFVNRVAAYFDGTPPAHTMHVDLVTFAVVSGAAAVSLFRGMWLVALVFASGYVASRLFPEHVPRIFGVTAITAMLVGAKLLSRTQKKP